MSGRLADRVAVITGGGSGIGLECARRFVREGAHVVLGDRDPAALERAASELGADATTVQVDVTDEESVIALVAAASERGGPHCAVNAAGFGGFGLISEHDAEQWRAVVDTCLTGVMLSVKHEARAMQALGGGAIVNIASINARMPAKGMSAYCCAKAGVEMLTRCSAMEMGEHGIRVTGIGPGFVETPLTSVVGQVPAIRDAYVAGTPLGRAGQPDDIADVALFLVSDEGRWVSGDTIFVDGGAMTGAYPDLPRLAGL